jgi:hypothetical protein
MLAVRIAVTAAVAMWLAGCSAGERERSSRLHLLEKGGYQALYRADRRLDRVVYDENGDRLADALVFYGPDGRPVRAEIDSDHDGRIDRREYFDAAGRLVRLER